MSAANVKATQASFFAHYQGGSAALAGASRYFTLTGKATTLAKVQGQARSLQVINDKAPVNQSLPLNVIKVISYCTVIIPLVMLIIYSIARSYYTIHPQAEEISAPAPAPVPASASASASASAPSHAAQQPVAPKQPSLYGSMDSASVTPPSTRILNETHEEFLNHYGVDDGHNKFKEILTEEAFKNLLTIKKISENEKYEKYFNKIMEKFSDNKRWCEYSRDCQRLSAAACRSVPMRWADWGIATTASGMNELNGDLGKFLKLLKEGDLIFSFTEKSFMHPSTNRDVVTGVEIWY